MARGKKKQSNPDPSIYWRNGRAYGDVGGKREALAPSEKTWGTTDPEIAQALFHARLGELEDKRRGRAGAVTRRSTTRPDQGPAHLSTALGSESGPVPRRP